MSTPWEINSAFQDYLANEIQIALEKLTNQARFIQMIVDKKLIVANRKKIDIVQDLRKHNFRPFPKVVKETADGPENEADEDGEEEEDEKGTANAKSKGKSKAEGDTSDYDYLLAMAIWSLTKEKIAKLQMQAEGKEQELLALLAKSPIDLWNADLDHFLAEWDVRVFVIYSVTKLD